MATKRTRELPAARAVAPSHENEPPAIAEKVSRQDSLPLRTKKITAGYQLRVTLQDIAPPIWRRFHVRGDITLYRLHGVLQTVMGWTGAHLYDFVIGKTQYGPQEGQFGRDAKDDSSTRLSTVVGVPGMSFTYNYDFGDRWEHDILVEEVLPADGELLVPVCLSGERACPPENCGGAPGYADYLETIRRPSTRGGKNSDPSAGGFDPEALDLPAINNKLRSLR